MSHLVLREYPHNSFICRMGDEANVMYFLESGAANVLSKTYDKLDELQPGRYFGEYAALTGDKRSSNIQAKGAVQVYELDKKILLALSRAHPMIYGLFLKNVYVQSGEKYQKLTRLLNARRGINYGGSRKKSTLLSLVVNYYIVFFILLNVLLFSPNPADGPMHPVWFCSPVVFMVGYMFITKRALEALMLSTMYIMIIIAKLNFVGAFYTHLLGTITETVDIILMVMLMGSLTRNFSASGSINALKYAAQKKIKSGGGVLFTAFLSMAFISIDEYLSVLVNGACFIPLTDEKRVPREKSAMVMGMSPGAFCILNPVSLTGIYITGMLALSGGEKEFFIGAIRYNFGAMITAFFILLLIMGKLPLAGALKKAVIRVKEGGPLWPEGTDNPANEEDSANQGRVMNLVLPVLVLIFSSILTGSLEAGTFQVNVLYGMIITLIFIFPLYCFQRYMTPDQFFKNVVYGIEGMIGPIVLFIVGKCFANGIEEIGFSAWLNEMVERSIQGQGWLLPVFIFSVCTIVGALFDNPWAMYAIGLPVAIGVAQSMSQPPALYVGAVCAAGLLGNEIALGDIFFIGPILGVNPMSYYRAKLPYVITIAVLTFFAYGAAGWFSF
ncbi:MAG: cyclic nucleotide-binding domain-containing protein [Treponema sp.]|nr:cyclic nucleotide-binding domain-containing protein [Treponema sp.]